MTMDSWNDNMDCLERTLYLPREVPTRPARHLGTASVNPAIRLMSKSDLARIESKSKSESIVRMPATPVVEVSADGSCLEPQIYAGFPISMDQRRRNIIVTGATGSGKTYVVAFTYVDATSRETNDSLLVVNTKGPRGTRELQSIIREHRPNDPQYVFAPSDPGRSHACNLLQMARRNGMLNTLKRAIVGSMKTGANESGYWKAVAEQAIGAAMKHPEVDSLATLHELFQSATKLRDFASEKSDSELIALIGFLDTGSHNAATNFTDIAARVAPFVQSDETKAVTSGVDGLDLHDILQAGRPFSMIIEANEATFSNEREVINVFLALLFESIVRVSEANQGELPTPLTVVLDEFGTIGQIEGFPIFVNTARSRGVSIMALVQSLTQLPMAYGDSSDTVLGGFNSKIYLCSGLSSVDRDYASRQTGVIAVREWQETQHFDPNEGNWYPGSRTEQIRFRTLLTPDDFQLEPHVILGPFAIACLVDSPPALLHFTPAWNLPHVARHLEERGWNAAKAALKGNGHSKRVHRLRRYKDTDMLIANAKLPPRVVKALRAAGIEKLSQLQRMSWAELAEVPGIGRVALSLIRDVVDKAT